MALAIPALIGLAGTGLSAVGQHQAADAAEAQGQRQSILDQAEGRVAEQTSLTQEQTQRNTAREFLGRQAAAIGQSGTGFTGSNLDVMHQSAVNAELDALNVRYKGQMTKYGYDYNSQSALAEGKSQQRNYNLMAGATLLKGAANYYGSRNG